MGGTPSTEGCHGQEKCAECGDGFELNKVTNACDEEKDPCSCSNGTASVDEDCDGEENCTECAEGFELKEDDIEGTGWKVCEKKKEEPCTCDGGTPPEGCHGQEKCAECGDGFELNKV